ncbi:MAG: C39 family peptidase [Patescibacteria group bacterium]
MKRDLGIKQYLKISIVVFALGFLLVNYTQAASITPSVVKPIVKAPLIIKVPFTTQAPNTNWSDSRQQDGCEEAVSIMAMAWVKNEGLDSKNLISKKEFEKRIIAISDFEKKKYGEYRDVTLKDISSWIFKDYFKYEKVSLKTVTSTKNILAELEKGRIVLLPMNGQLLKNPNFKAPGPLTHMILVKGYDYKTKEFITNDPGTRKGENYRYSEKVIMGAIRVYPTGYHLGVKKIEKAMIVVEK